MIAVRPQVIVHTMVSVDGRTDHVAGDVGLYYELAADLTHDAVLTGSSTLVAAAEAQGIDLAGEDSLPAATGRQASSSTAGANDAANTPPLLVIVDSRGQLTRFGWLKEAPYWRDMLVACSRATPASHIERLARHGIRYVVAGDDRVDLGQLLETLGIDEGIERIRVDSGGALSGALLRTGLVDEISLLIGSYAVGGRSPAGLFVADDLADDGQVTRLELASLERVRGDAVWLRYRVVR